MPTRAPDPLVIIDSVIKYDDDDNSAIDEHYLIENDRDEEEAP